MEKYVEKDVIVQTLQTMDWPANNQQIESMLIPQLQKTSVKLIQLLPLRFYRSPDEVVIALMELIASINM